MSTSKRETRPAERAPVKAETAPGSELSSGPVTGGDAKETAPLSGRIAAPPDDARQLELEIERTREHLGETVQELVAKADVKGRALAKATEVSGQCKSSMVQARNQVARNTAAARQKAASTGRAGKDQLRGRVAAAGAPAWEAMPEQVRRAVTKGATGARQHWMPLAVAAGVVIIGCLAVRQWKVSTAIGKSRWAAAGPGRRDRPVRTVLPALPTSTGR
jgi:hypothetical protein